MPVPNLREEIQEIPAGIVGANTFGRYPKISQEQTWNMLISDECLVPYAGYKNVLTEAPTAEGRGIYVSSRGNLMVAVWGSSAYVINASVTTATNIGNLGNSSGDVFIAENNNGEIAISDGTNKTIYVYNWLTAPAGPVTAVTVPASTPGYISFQDGFLILADTSSNAWYLSKLNDALTWTGAGTYQGALQGKPDTVQAAVPVPGGGNSLLLLGHTIGEPWQNIGAALFPYQRNSTNNVDYGCLNASSIASLDNFIFWLASNDVAGASIMIYSGGQAARISTDGIDFKLANLSNPSNCTGFLFRQDGHIIYQFTFPDDNLSYAYDMNTKKFFTVSDEDANYHIARNVVFFNNKYYFVSLNGGNLFEFGTQFTDIENSPDDIQQIPRIRITPPLRLPSQRYFIMRSLGFTIENGQPNTIINTGTIQNEGFNLATEDLADILTEDGLFLAEEFNVLPTVSYQIASEIVDLSISRDGAESFGSHIQIPMNALGLRKSRFIFQRLGQANDATFQIRFLGFGRFVVVDNGLIEAYQ